MTAAHPDGVLLLDKPAGFSSTQALARAKRLLGARKAGHTGTLDPFATGLLPLALGEATKFSRFLIDSAKAYTATLRLGIESSTGDPEGELTAKGAIHVTLSQIDEVLAHFHGAGEQTPPMHSAVRVAGKRLYDLAREGKEVARAPRRIEILDIRRESLEGDRLVISVACSKGTYIRTLAMDIGRRLGCGAYLTGLRRTAVGGFALEQAVTLERLEQDGVEAARGRLLPLEVLVAGLPRLEASGAEGWRFSQGQEIECPEAAPGSEWAVFGPGGAFLGVGRSPRAGRLAPLRLMAGFDTAKSPDFA